MRKLRFDSNETQNEDYFGEYVLYYRSSGHSEIFEAYEKADVIAYVREEIYHTAPQYFEEEGYLFTDEEDDSLPSVWLDGKDVSEDIYSQIF